jgi:hypothetical protein
VTRIPELEQELVAAAARLHSPRRVLRPGWRVALAMTAVVVAAVVALSVLEGAQNGSDRAQQRVGTPPPPKARIGEDGEAGVRFSLEERVLTVQVLASAPRKTRDRVNGARIRATCGKGFTGIAPRQTQTRLWPAGRRQLRYSFALDVSSGVRWCRLEDPVVGHVAFVKFRGASPGAMELIDEAANNWARLFAASDEGSCNLMTHTGCERESCVRVFPKPEPVPKCTRPSTTFRRSFRDATVQEIAINGDRAAARFSNGETVLVTLRDDDWSIHKFGGNAGRGFFEK